MKIPFTLRKTLLVVRRSILIIVKLVIIDQVVKWYLINYLRKLPGLTLKITSFFDLVYSWNYGISFGILRNYYQYSNMFFKTVNSLIIACLWYISLKCKSALEFVGYSFIIGGALGNLIDRFAYGAVFDFIYFHYKDYGFPIFNIADSFISIGAILLIYDLCKKKKKIEEDKKILYNKKLIQAEADRIREADFKKYKFIRKD